MNRRYEDLLSMTDEKPSFFQRDGVPRWERFEPGRSNGVYAVEVAIMEIACQGCDDRFHVMMERDSHEDRKTLGERIAGKTIHYGDPPNVGCCDAGPTMNSEPVRIVEFWRREKFEWSRDPSLEIAFARWDDPMTDVARAITEAQLELEDINPAVKSSIRSLLAADDEKRAAPPTTIVETVSQTVFKGSDIEPGEKAEEGIAGNGGASPTG
jgi:hypothetical protein